MLTLPGYDIVEVLSEDDDTCVYRGVDQRTRTPVILKTLQLAAQLPDNIARLRHEYDMLAGLDDSGIARPVGIIEYQRSLILIQEDIGGAPLTTLIAQGPCPLVIFFPLALALVDILDHVHRRHIIHRDLKPSNIIRNAATGQVQLIDFELASQLSREHPQFTPPDQIEGTLPYLAPEQTGRMNRTVDYRADFYALGVTFYQLLTGELPFVATDPLEWVHSHLSRVPRSPIDVLPSLPLPLADLVLKLLAKLAEERYQSAVGLRTDLRECQRQWHATGQIAPFALGQHDISDRFQLPLKLYGREDEVATLLAAFNRVATIGQPELLLVAGYAGIGKSVLVAELHKPILARRGFFISGKFDQYRRGLPYATLGAAFRTLIQQLLTEDADRVELWRQRILDAVGGYGQLLIEIIPQVQLIIGPQPPVAELPPELARHRLQSMFQQFVGIFASANHPLVLFLDDLQWADTASVALLMQLVSSNNLRALLVIGAYRDNEVGLTHPVQSLLDHLRKHTLPVTQITLIPLTPDHVRQILAETLHCDPAHADPLAQLVFEKTQGNPFFCFQFLTALYQDGLLIFDWDTQSWTWDLAQIQSRDFTDNVVTLMLGELQRLPAATQQILALAGLLGNRFDLTTLALVGQQTEVATEAHLWPALQVGLLTRTATSYRFLHDRVQEAAYALTPPAQRAALHVHIGRMLRDHTPEDALDERIFEIVGHLNGGASELTDPAERLQVAALNRRVGTKAQAATVYTEAVRYFATGIDLLPADHWTSAYALSYGLYLARAECELVLGNFVIAEQVLQQLLEHADTNLDRAKIYQILSDLAMTQGNIPGAREIGLASLRGLGIDLPVQGTCEQAQQAYEEFTTLLADRPIASLIDLPPMTDPVMQMAMRVLVDLCSPALFTDEHFLALGRCVMVSLCLRYGNAETSPHGYGFFGMTLAGYFHHYQEGYRFSELAHALLERQGLVQYRGQILLQQGIVAFWVQPIDASLLMLREAFSTLVDASYPMTAYFCTTHMVSLALVKGNPLEEVFGEAERALELANQLQYQDGIDLLRPLRQVVQLLRGQTIDVTSFDDPTFDEGAFEDDLRPERMTNVACWYAIYKLMAHCITGNYAEAHAAAREAEPLLWASQGLWQLYDYYYYDALALAAIYDTLAPEVQPQVMATIQAHEQQLRIWAQTNAATFAHSHALVAAEIDRICNRDLAAIHGYERAIHAAHAGGFVHNEALANELAAHFYRQHNLETNAEAHLHAAHVGYTRWGAAGKVAQLEARFPQLRTTPVGDSRTGTSTPLALIDVLAIVKAAQAISGEIVHDQLRRKLMEIVLEQSGAQRGVLLLIDGTELQVAATAQVARQEIQVQTALLDVPTAATLPLAILAYVQRSSEYVLLHDMDTPHPFVSDPYLVAQRPRSVLCLPILRQSALRGILYLEHHLLTHLFTPSRIAVLEQLATQATISLENAQLYTQLAEHNRTLEQQVAARTAQLAGANAELEAANTSLEAFSFMVSHDLRAPLHTIDGYLTILEEEYATVLDADGLEFIDVMHGETARMRQLIDDLLAFARLSYVRLQTQTIDMTAMARSVFEEVAAQHDPDRLDFQLARLPSVIGDPGLLRQVWVNLLSNAVKYSSKRERAVIQVCGRQQDGLLTYEVQDNGAGFDMQYIDKLFGVFQRLHSDGDFPGTGVGLAAVQRIIERHGGRIWAEGVEDQGATFWFTLPSDS